MTIVKLAESQAGPVELAGHVKPVAVFEQLSPGLPLGNSRQTDFLFVQFPVFRCFQRWLYVNPKCRINRQQPHVEKQVEIGSQQEAVATNGGPFRINVRSLKGDLDAAARNGASGTVRLQQTFPKLRLPLPLAHKAHEHFALLPRGFIRDYRPLRHFSSRDTLEQLT